MAPGALTQDIYIPELPSGLKVIITGMTWKGLESGWWPGFTCKNGSVYKPTTDAEKQTLFPCEFDKDYLNGRLAQVYISSQYVTDRGDGPTITISFKLEGTAEIDGKQYASNNRDGFIHISTSPWDVHSRPDYINMSYNFSGEGAQNLANEILDLQSPKDIALKFVVDGGALGMKAEVLPNWVKDAAGKTLGVVFWAHKKVIGKVVGWIW